MSKSEKDPVKNYLVSLAPDARRSLMTLRDAIRSVAPDAVEGVSYGVLGYKLDGRPLVYAGGFARHVGFYPLTPAIRRAHKDELAKHETSKGTMRFPLDKAVPVAFVKRMVKTRIAEMRVKAAAKTSPTRVSPKAFVKGVENEQRRKDGLELLAMMEKVTGHKPKMWGPTIVGFDQYHYAYESGREGDAPIAAFSPRKADLVIYVGMGADHKPLLAKLGKHRAGVSCLYLKKLDDVDRNVLRKLVASSVDATRRKYPGRQRTDR